MRISDWSSDVCSSDLVIRFTFIAALIFRPLAGVDRVTAFFATAAGGVADMAIVAREHGGDSGAVAIVHALRVSSVVAVVPVLVINFGAPGSLRDAGPAGAQNLLPLAIARSDERRLGKKYVRTCRT